MKYQYRTGYTIHTVERKEDWKICTKCHLEKRLSEFHRNPKSRDGYANICKGCIRKQLNKSAYSKLRFTILERDNFTCQYCGRTPQDGVKLHIDHIIPKSKGGSDKKDNLITACEECNLSKSNKSLKS